MINNFLETKAGKRIAAGFAVFVVVVIGAIIYAFMTKEPESASANNEDKTGKTKESSEVRGQYDATPYSGKWYSNRTDEITIELKTDGTYQATAWLSKGTYHLIDNGVMVLEDKEGKTKKFKLQTKMGSTVMYLKEDKEEIYLYPNEEVKEKMETEISEQAEAAQQVVSQMWMDILQQEEWENKTDKRTFTLTFKDDEFIQKKIEQGKKEEEITYKYRIVSIDYEQSSAVFVMSRTDSHDQKQDVVFKIKEEGSKYILLGNPGTFDWITTFEKSYAAVTPTQDGTTRSDTVKKTTETVDKDGNKVMITEKVKG